MNRTLPISSTPASVTRSTSLWLLAGALLLGTIARADDSPKAPPVGPILNLADGGVVPGSLEGFIEAGAVRWKTDSFAAPLEFAVNRIQSIRFPIPDKLARPTGAFGFELTSGGLVFGSIVSLDEKSAELDVTKLGRLKVERSRIQRIFRWRDGADLVYNGPNGMIGWREIIPPKRTAKQLGAAQFAVRLGVAAAAQPAPASKPAVPAGPGWSEDGGQLQSNKDGASIRGEVGLPARASLELELSWKQKPDFLLAIGVSDDEKSVARAFRFEVWDGQLVALREWDKIGDVVPIQTINDGPGRAQLQLFLDQELGKLLVFSNSGELLAELKVGGGPGSALTGVRLTNLKGDLRLERLRVGRWDGETPRPMEAGASRIQLTDLSISRGQVDRLDATSREFVVQGEGGESRVAEDKVSNIFFARAEDNTPPIVRIVYQDGTRIGGTWVNVLGGALVLNSPGIAGQLQLPMDGLRSVDVLKPDPKTRDKDAVLGTLEMDGARLLGCLVNSGDRPGERGLVWQPFGSDKASPIRPGASGRIIYRTPTPTPKPAQAQVPGVRAPVQRNLIGGFIDALGSNSSRGPSSSTSIRRSLYLRTGDIIPAEVLMIDERGVKFRTEFSENSFVPHSRIKAVEMAPEVSASIKVNKAKFERLLTLPRMQRDSPPTHLIRSKNGDILRGRVIAMDDKTIRVEVRLEEKVIDRDRVSRIIWLHADETDPSKKTAEPPEQASTNRVQAVRSDGIRLTFNAERFADGVISGKSEALGDCKVKVQDLDHLLIGGFVEKEATQLAYQNWKLQNAPDPKAMQDDDASSGGGEGTESALVGKPAPDFELELMGANGKKFHLADNKGKVIVLDFWATWCGPCVQAMPQIEKVTHEFADKGVQLIAVNLQETPDKISAMLERQKLSPTVALDRDGVVAQRYAANAIPQTVVIDREGKVTRLFIGGGPKLGDQLREALQALMPAEKP